MQPSPLSHVGPSSAVHAAAATLGLVVVEAGCVARGRAALRPASCEPPHGTRPMGDSRAVGSKEKGGRTWNQSSCRKLWLRQFLGRTVMTNLTISELLMLTCCGAFIASVTYAVKLSIEAF